MPDRKPRSAERERSRAMAEPRLFRARARQGEILAMDPQAVDFSYLYTGTRPNDRTEDGIAIVSINGPLEHHATYWWDSYESIVERIEDAMTGRDICKMHEAVNGWSDDYEPINEMPARAVVLVIDSPGGEAAGATWCHRRIRTLRKQYNIPIYAYANETTASAAYEIACAADEIWLPDTGTVGSIGVIATMFDRTKANDKDGLLVELVTSGEQKADGHADREITDDIRDRMQARVYKLANVFWGVVASSRNMTVRQVAALEAGVFTGQDAVDVGIADGIAGYERFLRFVRQSVDEQTQDIDLATSAA